MVIATFGPSTGWVGKKITFENDQFILEGHGPVSASDVMQYGQQGHLVWPNDGIRAWVEGKAGSTTNPVTLATIGGSALQGETRRSSSPPASVSAPKKRTVSKVTAAVVIGVVAFIAIIGIAAAVSSMHGAQGQAGNAYNNAVNQLGSGSTYTLAQFNQIQTGMTRDQVTSILGSGGTMTAQNNLAGTSTEAYSYQNPSGSNMQLMFQNGALIQKAQFGLQ